MSFVWFFENSYHFCVYLFSHYMIHLLLLTNDQSCWLIKSIFSILDTFVELYDITLKDVS